MRAFYLQYTNVITQSQIFIISSVSQQGYSKGYSVGVSHFKIAVSQASAKNTELLYGSVLFGISSHNLY